VKVVERDFRGAVVDTGRATAGASEPPQFRGAKAGHEVFLALKGDEFY
jgi:hypothetical protein